ERGDRVAELDLEQLQRVDLVEHLGPGVVLLDVGDQAAGVDRRARQVRLQRGATGLERQRGEGGGVVGGQGCLRGLALVVGDRVGGQGAGDRGRVCLGDPV